MEKYFKPVHCPSDQDNSKQQHCHLNPREDRYITCSYPINADHSSGHCSQQRGHHCQHQNTRPDENEFDCDQSDTQVTLSRASSSSLTSSSSSSSAPWYPEVNVNHTFTLRHSERPQHSLSCSNIHEARRLYQLDDATDPVVFATVKHGSNRSVYSEAPRASNKGKQVFAPLDRSHSRSDDGFAQRDDLKLGKSHLNRSLGFSEEDIMLGVSRGPKRAISSSQLPNKGILKNKEPHSDIRKAKSMEVLSPRVTTEQGQKAKGPAKVDAEKAKENFVQEKIKFSAFLDEITKQVISPSDLKTLGLHDKKNLGFTQNEPPQQPQLPPKKHRDSFFEDKEQTGQSKQVKSTPSSARKHTDPDRYDKSGSDARLNHHRTPSPHSTHNKIRKDRRAPLSEAMGYGRSGVHLTDGTSTSPELSQPKHRHKHAPQNPLLYEQHRAYCPPSSRPSAGGMGSESSSSKSDSSRTRETVSTATSSELSGCYHSQPATLSEPRQGSHYEADHLQALQEENADLHQNLLQTVVCIENLETELQHTKDELIHVKEKYKSLLESQRGPPPVSRLLQDHLHEETETLSNESQYMCTRVAQLSSELEAAHKTIAALEHINVPNLIKDLLEKHLFTSVKQQFVTAPTALDHLYPPPRADPKVEGLSQPDWSQSASGPQRPTAFCPVTHGLSNTEAQSSFSGSLTPCSSHFGTPVTSTAFCNKMSAGMALPIQPTCVRPLLATFTADTAKPSGQQTCVGGDNCAGQEGVKVVQAEQAVVTALSAQQILNDFMQQLQVHKEPGRDSTEHKAC